MVADYQGREHQSRMRRAGAADSNDVSLTDEASSCSCFWRTRLFTLTIAV